MAQQNSNSNVLQEDIENYQNLEKQFQMILLQKHQMQLQLNEVTLALEELSKAKGDVYKSAGGIMLKSTKDEAEKDLREKKDLFDIRMKTLAQQEEKAKTVLLKLQRKIQGEAPKPYDPAVQ
jgi:prefoldin beta subunit